MYCVRLSTKLNAQMDQIQLLSWENRYLKEKERYLAVCRQISEDLNKLIRSKSIKCDVSYRVKTWDSFLQKISRKNYIDPFNEIEDFSGVRCVTIFSDDLIVIDGIIKDKFDILDESDKKEALGNDRMGYQSKHYIVKIKDVIDLGSMSKCEIQIRTSLQNSWADLSHTLIYKNTEDDKYDISRKINNISSALEVVQDQVDSIRRGMQKEYSDIKRVNTKNNFEKLLNRDIIPGLLARYCAIKFSKFVDKESPMDMVLLNKAINDMPEDLFQKISDIDNIVEKTLPYVLEYKKVRPDLFPGYVDYLTKCLIFGSPEFLASHGAAPATRQAAMRYQGRVE